MKTKNIVLQILGILAMVATITLSACSKGGGGSGNNGGTVASTPSGCNTGYGCYTTYGGGYFNQGAQVTYNHNGYCGCPVGQMPVYNAGWGYACVSSTYMTSGSYYGYNYNSFQAQNLQPLNMQQVIYGNPITQGNTSCYQNVAAACDLAAPSTCSNGGVCQQINAASRIGVCSAGASSLYQNGYSYQNNGGYYQQRCVWKTKGYFSYYYCY